MFPDIPSLDSFMFRAAFSTVLVLMGSALAGAQEPLAPLPPALPRTHTPAPTTSAITVADLKTRLYIFADDSMRGRAVGRVGNAKGTTYIADEIRRIGLQPAGDSGTYFQNLPGYLPVFVSAQLRTGNTSLTVGRDFLPIGAHGMNAKALVPVFGGTLNAVTALTPNQIAGKLVVVTAPSGVMAESLPLPPLPGVGALAIIALDSMSPVMVVRMANRNVALMSQPDYPVLLLTSTAAKQLLGQDVGRDLHAVAAGTLGKPWSLQSTVAYSARNVVAILPGSDPVLRHQYVALGAHNDHIGWQLESVGDHDSLRALTHFASIEGARTGGNNVTPSPEQIDSINATLARLRRINPPRRDSIFNGADDDGSGSMSLLEIAQQLATMKVKPKRSILFVWHTGEEAGLLGSAWFTEHPTVPINAIVAQLNIDMIGRGDASDVPGGNPNYLFVVGSRRMANELGDLIERVNVDDHHGLELHNTDDGYLNSDHVNYARHGIPITFFKTGRHSDYHQVTDEPQYIDYPKMARVAAFLSDVAVHIANLDHRLVIDQPAQPRQ